jgi:hypothetical protein
VSALSQISQKRAIHLKKHIYGCSKMDMADEAANTSLLLDPEWDQTMIYQTRGEHANYHPPRLLRYVL